MRWAVLLALGAVGPTHAALAHKNLPIDAVLTLKGRGTVRDFLKQHNPQALQEMIDRLIEAQERGLWRPRRNDTRALLDGLRARAPNA